MFCGGGASTALGGDWGLLRPRMLMAASSRFAWFWDEERMRGLEVPGGGAKAMCAVAGELVGLHGGPGECRFGSRGATTGDIVVEALLGAVACENTVEGDMVSAGEGLAGSAE